MDFSTFYDRPQLFGWVTMATFKDPDFAEDGCIRVEDFLDASDIYQAYPWMGKNVQVCLTDINSRVLNGEGIRIVTLGGGEGTIFIARQMWDDALEDRSDSNQMRDFLAKAVVHELGHALDDHDNTNDEKSVTEQEEFANEFMHKWYKS